MGKACIIDFLILRRTPAAIMLLLILVTIPACVKEYTDEMMQPRAATASDLARAVMRFARDNSDEAALLDDRELVRRATAFDPKMLQPYKSFVVRGTADGIILVCTSDGKRGLFEDAECTDRVDRILWSDTTAPCQFTLKTETFCP